MSDADNQALVAQILSSYLSNNTVAAADLPSVIQTVKKAFYGGEGSSGPAASASEEKKWEPAVAVRKSVTPDAVVCLCCGKKFKSLKRHLNAEHGLTPEQYREAFNLKKDHPIVAPNYAEQRSSLAKSLGLGRKVTRAPAAAKKGGAKAAKAKQAAQ
ncbi:MAG TPA: MucR family transcriptional regulator [Methylocystis sp.]|nr:MucR family transcriptional regulator [Methylocystis sp.]